MSRPRSRSLLPSLSPQIYPCHLAFYINRVTRVTPLRYYTDMLVAMLVAEKAYHSLPNFTVRVGKIRVERYKHLKEW